MVSEMKYIKDYKDGDRVFDIYFCKYKSSAVTKNGKNYDIILLYGKNSYEFEELLKERFESSQIIISQEGKSLSIY